MRTIQKKIKFTKGMITSSLEERTDLPVYDSSAKLIRNYVCTPYGGFRTRRGTRLIQKLDLADRLTFNLLESKGTYVGGNFVSNSLSTINDGEVIAKFELNGGLKSEANIYLNNLILDFEMPKLTAIFEETGYKLEARMTDVQIVNGGVGFEGKLNVVGTVKEGKTEITPTINELGTITNAEFKTALYQYLPETPQDVQVSAIPPKCEIGISTSPDGIIWTEDRRYKITSNKMPRIKIQSYNCRFFRIKYFGRPLNTVIRFNDVFAKYEFYKLVPFIYNTTQKNMIVLSEKKILIFEDNKLSKTIEISPELCFKNVRAVKYSQNEDVIIFTESGVKPRELRRTINDWVFKEFPVKNIPFHNFSETKEETKTIGITPNYVSGAVTLTADNNVFTAESVGQQIDGNGGRYKITEYVNEKKVIGYTIIPFLNVEKITKWKLLTGWEKVWSESRGWPITCLFYQQRLWFGGSTQRPSTIWASRTGIYNDFNNAGNYDNDAINQDMNTENQIVNLLSNRGLQIFTSGDEWTASEGSLTPNAFNVFKNTAAGSSINLIPKNLGGVTLFVEKNGKSLLSYVYDYNQAAYKTSNISILANLIAEPVDMEIDDNSSLDEGDYLYIVMKDGRMLITSINFEQEINAPSIFESKGSIQSVCNLINDTYLLENLSDETYLVVIDDSQKTDMTISKFVDKTIIGLENYNGYEVYIYSKDQNFGKYYVENGTVTLNKEAKTDCNIGLVFNSELDSNEIAINGKSTGIRKRISKAVITTHDTDTIRLNGVIKHAEDNIFDFYAVTSYGKRVNFKIESEFERVEVLSILLNINYGVN